MFSLECFVYKHELFCNRAHRCPGKMNEYAPEEDTLVPLLRQPEPEHPKARHVLETMKNLIVEI